MKLNSFDHLLGLPFDEKNIKGVNCHELLRRVFKVFDIKIPSTDISVCACKQVSNREIDNKIKSEWERLDAPEVPCGVVISPSNKTSALHLATYVSTGKILHITQNINSMVENIYPKYKTRILGFYKFTGKIE